MDQVFSHTTVLLDEAVEALVQNSSGYYIDGTFGRGGHSAKILQNLAPDGQLLAIDKDLTALEFAQTRFSDDPRFAIAHGSFAEMAEMIATRGKTAQVDGVLLDLGVSSPQLDDPERGFSFQYDGPLDMRMDRSSGESAADWLARADEKEIADVIFKYGEDRFARRYAKAIVAYRQKQRIETTAQLSKLVAEANPAWEKGKNPATRAFQAIRIHINRELEDLERCLEQSLDVLKDGGRLVVISFHSLEDRIVKRFMRRYIKGDEHLPAGLPYTQDMLDQRLRAVGKAVKPSNEETVENPRARSAMMRVAERVR